jgi:hypothetical protein
MCKSCCSSCHYIAKILDEWPFYADLHDLWSELPNYNPVGVSNTAPGQDLAGQAASLFEKPSKSKTPIQEVEDEVPEVLEDDEDDCAGDPNTSEWTTEDNDVGDVGATVEDDDDEVESAVVSVACYAGGHRPLTQVVCSQRLPQLFRSHKQSRPMSRSTQNQQSPPTASLQKAGSARSPAPLTMMISSTSTQ